jgi:hypothetical protein
MYQLAYQKKMITETRLTPYQLHIYRIYATLVYSLNILLIVPFHLTESLISSSHTPIRKV